MTLQLIKQLGIMMENPPAY